jgi:NitT/TauT family transport system substrate-binding protein
MAEGEPHVRRCLIVLVCLLAGAARAQSPWRHGTVLPKGDAGFIYMAAEGGFASRNGLALQMVAMQADALLLKALIAGELDSYEGSPGAPMIAASRGADVKIIGCHWPGLTYDLYATPEIGSLAELRGHTIAIAAPSALPDLFTRVLLRQAGIPVGAVTLAPTTNTLPQLVARVVDATAATSEYRVEAQAMGLHILARGLVDTPNYLRMCMMTTGAVLGRKPDEVVGFLRAEMQAYWHAMMSRDEVLALSARIAHEPPGYGGAAAIYDDAVQGHAVDPTLGIDIAKLDWMRDLLVSTGNLKAGFDPRGMVAAGPREKALANP